MLAFCLFPVYNGAERINDTSAIIYPICFYVPGKGGEQRQIHLQNVPARRFRNPGAEKSPGHRSGEVTQPTLATGIIYFHIHSDIFH